MKLMGTFVPMLAGIVAASAFAGTDDFARARLITEAQNEPVQRALIPQDVYEWSTRDDLGDVRVFNGTGDEMAYAIARQPVIVADAQWRALPLFSLPAESTTTGAPAVKIEVADGGAIVAVRGSSGTPNSVRRFLLDATAYDADVAELDLMWPADVAQFVASVAVEGSNDLTAWATLVANATVAVLAADGHSVRVARITMRPVKHRYFRIVQTAGALPLPLTGVSVRSSATAAVSRSWRTLTGVTGDDGLTFDTGGRFPVDRITLERDGSSYLQSLELFSRPSETTRWHSHGTLTFYRVSVDGRAIDSEPVSVSATTDRFWRISTDTARASTHELRIGWAPHELVFVAQGTPPFALAYGRADLAAAVWPMDDLIKKIGGNRTLASLPVAQFEPAVETGGSARLLPGPKPINWPTIGLWAALVLGVGLVGVLAVRLVRSDRS